MADQPALFDTERLHVPPASAQPTLSADRRRTVRQAAALAGRAHPLSLALGYPIRLRSDAPPAGDRDAPGPRCGTCLYRRTLPYHNRAYPKCLCEVEALRRIVDLHERIHDNTADRLGFAAPDMCSYDGETWPCPTVRAVAAIWSDHPDYRQEWQP